MRRRSEEKETGGRRPEGEKEIAKKYMKREVERAMRKL